MSRLLAFFLLAAPLVAADLLAIDPPTLKVVGNVVEKCIGAGEWGDCLEDEAASAVGKALTMDKIPLVAGFSLIKTGQEPETSPRALDTPADKLWDNVSRLFASRSIAFQLPEMEESRGKKKKVLQMIAVAAATAAAILIPIKLKAIALVAFAALMIGKLALVLASLAGLKKLVSKPQEETTHVHYDNHRSDPSAHFLAYSSQAPYSD